MVGEMNIKPNAFQKIVHRFLMLRSVSALLAKILHRADTFMLRLTGNRHTFAELVGLPIIQLTTIGARTNQSRTLPLVGIKDNETIALIASRFGSEHNPGWYYNLKAHPECDVLFNGRSGKYISRELTGEEYNYYWQMAVSYYAGYEKYKERAAHRHIPVMLLEPKIG
jgi:deazaflavin-dependent oxidoreductase (nitroreductase family)